MGVLLDKRFTTTLQSIFFYSFEHFIVAVDFLRIKLNLVTIYRPPNLSVAKFFEEFQSLLSFIISLKSNFIITGDFNLHVDVPNTQTENFNNILNTFNLKQHVSFPTHKFGHSLDLFITPDDCPFIKSIIPTDFLSDHSSITATLNFDITNRSPHKTIKYRQYNKIDMTRFRADLERSDLIQHPKTTSSELYNQYHSVLADLVERHAPLKSKSCPSRPPDPWITEDILRSKRTRRRLERTWRRTRSVWDRRRLSAHVHQCNRLISNSKKGWYSKIIQENQNNPKKLWSSINRILHRNNPSPLPDCSNISDLANSFGTFFTEKNSKIRTALNSSDYTGEHIKPNYYPPALNQHKPITLMRY